MSRSKFIFVTALLLAAVVTFLSSRAQNDNPPRVLAGKMLQGQIKDSGGKPLEGVGVSARAVHRTFTTTVYSDDAGAFVFPNLEAGQYQVWAQAVGYVTGRADLALDPGKPVRHDFSLETLEDFTNQLSGTEWVAALPEDTPERRRRKEIFRVVCTECHSGGFVLQNRFDEKGWRNIIDVMGTVDYFGIVPNKKPSAVIEYVKEEMVQFLTEVRGPGPSPMKFKPYPRPRGEAARVVITEYDIPPGETPDSLSLNDGSDWMEGTASIGGVGSGVHDVHVDMAGNAWAVDSALNPGRTYMKVDTVTGKVTAFKIPAPPDGTFARGSHSIVTDPKGILWFDVRALPGLTGFGSLGRVDPATEKLSLFTPSPEMSNGVNRTVDFDALGRIWASTNSGAVMFDPASEKFTYYASETVGGAIASYGVAGDADGNGWWTQSGQDLVVMVDTKTGKQREFRMKPRTTHLDLVTPEDRQFYSKSGITWAESQYPRRLGADKNGTSIWVPNYVGGNMARIDSKTFEVEYYDLPIDSAPYFSVVDKNHVVWTNLTTNERIAKYDPQTKEWTIFVLPSLGGETRHIAVDNFRDPVEVWVPYFRTSRIARLQFRTQEQLDAALTP